MRLSLLALTLTLATMLSLSFGQARSHALPASGPPGVIETYAGGGTDDGDVTTRADAFMLPYRLASSPQGELLVTEFRGVLRKVTSDDVTRIAGARGADDEPSGDGGPAVDARFGRGVGVDVDAAGNVYIADSFNCAIRRIDAITSIITTVAGRSAYYCGVGSGDGSLATSARLFMPDGVAVDDSGQIYIAETPVCRLRRVDTAGIIATLAGSTSSDTNCENSGDGGPASDAQIGTPIDVEVSTSGDIYVLAGCSVRRIHAGIIETVGGGRCGYGVDGPAINALAEPVDIALDENGNLFIAEYECRVRMVADGVMTTVIGSPMHVCADTGDGGLVTQATTRNIAGITLDGEGNLYFSDVDADGPTGDTSNRIRVAYGMARDSDDDGYMDAAEAGIGEDPYSYCRIIRADVNRDSVVNSGDQLAVLREYGASPSTRRFDQNSDGHINSGDQLSVAIVYGQDVTACP